VDPPAPEEAVREAIRHWLRLWELAEFAVQRLGYGDSNGGFGITYPGDPNEYDRVVLGVHIPDGCVRVYGFWGPPDGYERFVPESVYLITLIEMLVEAGHEAEAEQVRALSEQLKQADGL
jgi:hypothetical protein